MTCTEYQRWFSPYLDAHLDSPQRAQLEAHLQGCTGCRTDLESLQQMLRALRAMAQPAVPALLPGIHEQLARGPWWRTAWRTFTAPWPASLPLYGIALSATALLVVVVVGIPRKPVSRLASIERSRATATVHREVAAGDRAKSVPEPAGEALPIADTRANESEGAGNDELRQYEPYYAAAPTEAAEEQDRPLQSEGTPVVNAQQPSAPMAGPDNLAMMKVATKPSQPQRPVSTLLQVHWRVSDLQAAASQVLEWVQMVEGLAVATNEHHLSVKLPASEVPPFLAQFSSGPTPEFTTEQPAHWVTISLELVPTE